MENSSLIIMLATAFFPQHDNSTTQSAKRGSGDNQYAFHLSPNVVSRSMSTELERLRHGPQSLDEGARGGRRRSMDDSVRPLEVSLKQSDQPMAVRANEFPVPLTHVDDHHSLQLSLIDAKSSSLIPLPSNNSTTLLVSSPPLPLDETIAASRSQAQSAASFRQHEQSQAVANANPYLRTSTCQSCEMDDNTVVLNLAEISSPPNGISIREERSSTRSSDCRAYSETRLVPSETRTGRRSPPSVSEADVPHGIESEIDTGTDVTSVDSMNSQKQVLPPPKNTRDTSNTDASDIELDTSTTLYDSAANETESFPMTRAPHTAYIAPALPPIRFSMNSADFADLLTSVSGLRIRDARTQPKQNDSGMGQVSPKVPMKQSNELSHERLNDYTHPKET
ncbi:hypothetical protein F5887DRAFT_629454 [Amanita rubescens]|nr:hypothetical protein F5887DRAFT_629454 [Amanita rubescens]